VTKLKERQALIKAFPAQDVRTALGGKSKGDLATTILSPATPGYRKFDLYDQAKHPNGDPAAAKKLLAQAGVSHPTITVAYSNNTTQQAASQALAAGLTKAGFKVELKALSVAQYYTQIENPKASFDLYYSGWGTDWPSASTVLPPLFASSSDGTYGTNLTHLHDTDVDQQVTADQKISDRKAANRAWGKLDRTIMKQAPVIPFLYDRFLSLYGSGLGGVRLDGVLGDIDPTGVYVK
jgi:peptide/nickel transport system substrate-binding protein